MKTKEVNLLKNKYPELLKEWDYVKNKEIDVNTISYSSHKIVSWICVKNKHEYDVSINNRTNISVDGKISGCKQCFHDTLRIQDKDVVVAHKNQYKQTRYTTKIGDQTEEYVVELLKSMNCYSNITNLGNLGANSDICITDDQNNTYYVQVKTLTYSKRDTYYMTNDIDKYPNNMLIIMVNNKRDRYALEFAGNIKVKRLCLTFDHIDSIYKDIMFTDMKIFKSKIKELVIKSYNVLEFTSEPNKKEYDMLKRFEQFCVKNNIKYIRNLTNGEASDGTINGYKFQAKYVSLNTNCRTTYQISSQKGAGTLNGEVMCRHYEVGDFDYFIIEIGGVTSNISKYENNYCIIPSSVLIEQNILKSDMNKGKKGFYICPPDYTKPHWSKYYWNVIPESLYK